MASYLAELDLSGFDPKAPPPKTDAFWAIVAAGSAPEDAEMKDALDRISNPPVIILRMLEYGSSSEFCAYLRERKNARALPFRLEECGYERVTNPAVKEGTWKFSWGRATIYALSTLSKSERVSAAKKLVSNPDMFDSLRVQNLSAAIASSELTDR